MNKKSLSTVLWIVVLVAEYMIANRITQVFRFSGWLPVLLVFVAVFVIGDLLVTLVLSLILKVSFAEAWDSWMGSFRRG